MDSPFRTRAKRLGYSLIREIVSSSPPSTARAAQTIALDARKKRPSSSSRPQGWAASSYPLNMRLHPTLVALPLLIASCGGGGSSSPAAIVVVSSGPVDLSVEKSVDLLEPREGESVLYTIRVRNENAAGSDEATEVVLTDSLPAGLDYQSDNPSQGSFDSSTGIWSVGTLPAAMEATLELRALVLPGTAGTTITNSIRDLGATQSDSDPSNDTAAVALTVFQEEILLRRDSFGVPHIFADTDSGAFYGLGYAAAQDRLFQMHWHRLIIQGRLSQFLGRGTDDAYFEHDKRMRIIGYARHAERVIALMEQEPRELLEAYADGVNAWMNDPGVVLHPMFASTGFPLEPWTAADCVAVWIRLARNFGGAVGEGLGKAKNLHQYEADAQLLCGAPDANCQDLIDLYTEQVVYDEAAAMMVEAEIPVDVRQAIDDYAAQMGVTNTPRPGPMPNTPKFSHMWAIGGSHTPDGKAVLVGDPRTTIQMPSSFIEFHMVGESFEMRGVGVPGSPNAVAGSTRDNAWSLASLGGDQADLFRLKTDVSCPDGYVLDGNCMAWEAEGVELILIKDEDAVSVPVRDSYFGPVVSDIVIDRKPDEEYSTKSIPLSEPERDSFIGFLRMYRATDLFEFGDALEDWRYPPANVLFADSGGRVGWWANGAFPLRSNASPLGGMIAQDGSSLIYDWMDVIPHEVLPHVLDPADSRLFNANHAPVGSWYPLPIRFGTNSTGDSDRSRRLRELVTSKQDFTAQEIEAFHRDTINPARRDIVRLGIYLRNIALIPFSGDADKSLRELEDWAAAGSLHTAAHRGVLLAELLDIKFRSQDLPVVTSVYGGSNAGLHNFLKEKIDEINTNGSTEVEQELILWLDQRLSDAWQLANTLAGPPSEWLSFYAAEVQTLTPQAWTTLDGLPPLADPAISVGPLTCVDSGTLLSQSGQAYTQVVRVGLEDGASSVLAFEQSENVPLGNGSQQGIFEALDFKPSPMSKAGIEAMGNVVDTLLLRP